MGPPPACTPTGSRRDTSWPPASSPTCLWVIPGAQPDAVTRPRGPSAFLAFVSDDAGSSGKGESRARRELTELLGIPTAMVGA